MKLSYLFSVSAAVIISFGLVGTASAATTNDLSATDFVLVQKLQAKKKLILKKNAAIIKKGSAAVKIDDKLTVTGKATFRKKVNLQKNIYNSTGDVTVKDNLVPQSTGTYDLGTAELQWNELHANNIVNATVEGVDVGDLQNQVDNLTDNDTTYTAGTGISLSGTEFSLTDNYQAEFTNVVVVSPTGASATENGTLLRDAISNIDDEASDNPYLVLIEPGVYNIGSTALTMTEYIHIRGLSEDSVTIEGDVAGSSTGLVVMTDNANLEQVAVKNVHTGSDTTVTALYADEITSSTVTSVTLVAEGAATDNFGLYVNGDSDLYVDNLSVAINDDDSTNNTGVRLVGAAGTGSIYLMNSDIDVEGSATTNRGVHSSALSGMEVSNTDIYASGATTDYAAHAGTASTNVMNFYHSSLEGDLLTDGFMTVIGIGNSMFHGSVSGSSTGTEICLYTHDATFGTVAADCT